MPPRLQMPAEDKSTTGGNVEASARERMVIRNADLSIVVKDPETAMTAITRLAEQMGGFVVSSNLYQTYTVQRLARPRGQRDHPCPCRKTG